MLCAQPTDPDERTAERDLSDFVRDLITAAPRSVKEVRRHVREAGYPVSDKTLQRVRRAIGAEHDRTGFSGEMVWSLPPDPDPDEQARIAMREGAHESPQTPF